MVQALNVGDTLTDTFKVTTVDGTPKVVTVTINGTNDAPNGFGWLHGDSFHFKDEIFGHKGSDANNPAVVDFAPVSTSHLEDAGGARGALTISEGAQTTEPSLQGQHSADHFSIAPDHAGGVVITHAPHDLIL